MTLLIVVEDVRTERELIVAARALAAAARWDVRAARLQGVDHDVVAGDLHGVELVPLAGDAWGSLARLVAQADVDCVAIGLHLADRQVLGSTAKEILEDSVVPVFLVRPGMRPIADLQRLLVPLEGTPSTTAAMLFAEAVLCRPGREIVMLNVATGRAPGEIGSLPAPRFIDQEQYAWSDWQDEFSMRFSQRAEGCRHRVSVLVGDPATTITEEAGSSEVDLIVLTWKGTFAEGHGRIVRRLLKESPCPLLVVPAGWTEETRERRAGD